MREENRSEIIHDALNLLDDALIEEVEELRGGVVEKEIPKKIYSWKKWTALAASVCVFFVAGAVWNLGLEKDIFSIGFVNVESKDAEAGLKNDADEDMENEEVKDLLDGNISDGIDAEAEESAITIPALNVNLKKENGLASDMIGFFIYEGRCYVQTCDYMTKDVVGDYVCTSTGLIDEWTSKDGYVEFAGSIEAEFYEVKGINPEFMLCTVYEDGVVETFVHNNGITLGRGWELLADRLGMEEEFKQVSYLTGEEWEKQYQTKQEPTTISDEHREIFDKFLASYGENKFVLKKNISTNAKAEAVYHLYITTKEDVPLHFLLLRDGYVSYYGLDQVCVKIDEKIYEAVVDILKTSE
ncbi:MAG: hypothetical protein IJE49_06805 [Agathobacter sp.]|nr:hypothetical protein [Agathobacter sp.]